MKISSMTPQITWRHYSGLALFSVATLLLELSLTRVLSVALWYHFGFLIISTALLGFGASGVTLALWRRLREEVSLDYALTTLALLFGLLTVICFWLMQRIPYDPFNLFADRRQLFFMPLYYAIISVPFFCSGLALALLFTRGTREVNRLYAFDLFGAGVGCAAIALVMPTFGGSGSIVIAAAIALFAAAIFASARSTKLTISCLVLCLGGFTLAWFADTVLPISVTSNKLSRRLTPLYTEWNTFSRIDVYERPAGPPADGKTVRRLIFDAGTAATGMSDLRPGVRDYLGRNPDDRDYNSGIAYVGKQHPKVLIIGSGGGDQVLDALHFRAREVTAVEINPIINDIVSRRMRDYWGGLFDQPEVHLVTEEGRSFVRRSTEGYDAIISVHTISNAAIASGALSLAENYVLTCEAFEDYLDHLTPDGTIYFTRPETQIPRLFATAREALAKKGIDTDVASHLYAYRIPPSGQLAQVGGGEGSRQSFVAGFLLKKSPFTKEEIHRVEEILGVGEPPRSPDEPAPEVLYSPLNPPTKGIYHALVSAPDLSVVYRSEASQIEPATDDRPFFNQHTRWSSITPGTFHDLFTQQQLGRLALEDRPVAEITLIILLIQTILISGIFILFPLVRFSRAGLRVANRWRYLLYFASLGLGFMMIEIALLGRFTLFLGQPVYTFAVVLASLLIFTGVGSFLSERLRALSSQALLRRIIPAILATLIVSTLLTPVIFSITLGLSITWRVAIAIFSLVPLGILLGVPFPAGLKIVSAEAPAFVPWSWGVNGFFTVIGTVAALMVGMTFGFKTVLLGGGLCYLIAWIAVMTDKRIETQSS